MPSQNFKDAKYFMVLDNTHIPIQPLKVEIDQLVRVPYIDLHGYIEGGTGFTDPIERVIFNDPATIVIWKDGSKTIVKCQDGDTYSKELGLAMAISKKFLVKKYTEESED